MCLLGGNALGEEFALDSIGARRLASGVNQLNPFPLVNVLGDIGGVSVLDGKH